MANSKCKYSDPINVQRTNFQYLIILTYPKLLRQIVIFYTTMACLKFICSSPMGTMDVADLTHYQKLVYSTVSTHNSYIDLYNSIVLGFSECEMHSLHRRGNMCAKINVYT